MSPASTSSTSVASPRSTSSNAAPRCPMAAAAVEIRAAGDVRRDVDRDLRLGDRPAPVADRARRRRFEQPAVGEESDERPGRAELLPRAGCAEAQLPAERPGAVVEHRPAQLELPAHSMLHARVFVQERHARIMAGLESVRRPGYLPEHM